MFAFELERQINTLLSPEHYTDYCINGIQVEGKTTISKIGTAVTANERTICAAREAQCDALLVHHGLFWGKDFFALKGIHKQRVELLISSGITLFAYHIPLDMHPTLGNNVRLIQHIGGTPLTPWMHGYTGTITTQSHTSFSEHLATIFAPHTYTLIQNHSRNLHRIAVVTGGGSSFIDHITPDMEIDLFISGEIKESAFDYAQEKGISYLALGHHQSELLGVQALGDYLGKEYNLTHEFLAAWNPY